MRREDQWEPWVGQRYNHVIENDAWPCHIQPSLVGVSVRFLWKSRKEAESSKMSQVRLGLLPDASSLLLGLLVGLMVKLLPAMYSDLHLVGKRQRRATSSEEIEEAMVHGMFEVPPPDLSNGDPTLYQGLIRALTVEAARSDLAAKSETLQEHCYPSQLVPLLQESTRRWSG